MKTKYWLTVSVPVEVENLLDAKDVGWERLIDPDGPPEGLVEKVTTQPILLEDQHDALSVLSEGDVATLIAQSHTEGEPAVI
jgi:hypothetical protein